MTMSVQNEDTLDTGASRRVLASGAQTLFQYAVTGDVLDDPPAELPWLGVVGTIVAYDLATEGEGASVSVLELAAQLRRAHQRVVGNDDAVAFELLAPKVQLGWEAAARFLSWAVQAGEVAETGLSDGLAGMGQWIDREKARRRLS